MKLFIIKVLLLSWFSNRNAVPVPFDSSQLTDKETALLEENYDIPENEVTPSTLNAKYTKRQRLLPQHNMGLKNKAIDDTPIEEHATDTPNVIKERAFVYLNQKFKTPIQKHVSKQDLRIQEVNIPSRKIKSWTKSQFSKISKSMKITSFFQPPLYQIVDPDAKQMDFYTGVNETKVKYNNYNTPDNNADKLEKYRNYLELLKKPAARKPYNKKEFEKTENMKYEKYVDKNSVPISQFNNDLPARDDGNEIFDGYENQIRDTEIKTYRPHLNSDSKQNFIKDQSNMKMFFNKEDPNSKFSNENQNCNQPDCLLDKHLSGKHFSKTRLRRPHKAGCDCNQKKIYDNNYTKGRIERGRQYNQIPTGHKCQNAYQDTPVEGFVDSELQNSVNILNRTLQMYR